MRIRRRHALGLLLLATAATAASLPPFTVLLKTGDHASDGLGVAQLGLPVAGDTGEIFFRGTTAAVLRADGGTIATVVTCGDPLPAPLTGTLGTFSQTVINDAGAIAFVASLNSTAATTGLLLREGTNLTTVSLTSASDTIGPGTGPFDLDGHGNVFVRSGNRVSLWTRATGQTARIATAASLNRFTGQPVIGDGGQVAWLGIPRRAGGLGGVYTWDPANGVVAVVEEAGKTATSSSFRRANVAINAVGQVAFVVPTTGTSVSGAFVWDPHTRVRQRLAASGDVVGGASITGFGRYIGIDSQGTVVLLARFGSRVRLVRAAGGTLTTLADVAGSNFPARLPDTGRVVWIDDGEVRRFDGVVGSVLTRGDRTPAGSAIEPADPSVNAAGAVVFAATHGALYRLAGGAATPIVQVGDPVLGGSTIRNIDAYAAASSTVVIFATTSDVRRVLLQRTATGPLLIAADGDPAPKGGTLDLSDAMFAVGDQRLAFHSTSNGGSAEGVFIAGPWKGLRAVARQGDAAPGGGHFANFFLLAAGGKTVVFAATVDAGPTALFRQQRRKTTRIVSTGQAVPGLPGKVFAWFSAVAATSDRVLFVAGVAGDTVPPGLYLWTHGKLSRLRTDANEAGANPFVTGTPIALAGRNAFVGGYFGRLPFAVYVARRNGLRALATDGEAWPAGGTVSLVSLDDGSTPGFTVSSRGDRVTLSGSVLNDGAAAEFLERTVPRR